MAALTDLTWQQVAQQLPADAITVVDGKVMVDVGTTTGNVIDALTDGGVVKFFSILFSAANKAQIAANQTQDDGEKLTAFSPATIGAAADGFVTLTRPFVCRSELGTATNIIGTNG